MWEYGNVVPLVAGENGSTPDSDVFWQHLASIPMNFLQALIYLG